MTGIFVIGRIMGLKGKDRKDRNGNPQIDSNGTIIKDWEVGISIPVPNGFEGETETISARFSAAHCSAGIPALYAKATGQTFMVPVWVQAWQTKDGKKIGYSLQISGDGKPSPVPQAAQPVKAAS